MIDNNLSEEEKLDCVIDYIESLMSTQYRHYCADGAFVCREDLSTKELVLACEEHKKTIDFCPFCGLSQEKFKKNRY